MALDAECPQRLSELTAPAPRTAAEHARKLHRDRRAARHDATGAKIHQRRTRDGAKIHAPVLEEAPVLDRDERGDHIRVDLIDRHPPPEAAVARTGASEWQARPVLEHQTGSTAGRKHPRGKWRGDPRAHTQRGE